MARRRHTPEQIVRKLREADRLLAEGKDLEEVARHLQVNEQTYHRWRAQYGGMKADDVQAVQGARGREHATEADRGGQGTREPGVAGDRAGKLVSPSRRRQAVHMLCERLGISQRRACQIVGQHRSTQRHQPAVADPDRDLRAELRVFAREHPRWGYRRAHAVLIREGPVQPQEDPAVVARRGLTGAGKRRKRQRLGVSTTPADRLHAGRPDHVWALDYQFDVTSTGRILKILHVVDEYTRESLADVVAYSIDADATVNALDTIVARQAPAFIRCDNGPELTANALRDWCRFSHAGASYIEPGSPWQNPWVESYGPTRHQLGGGEPASRTAPMISADR